MRSLNTLIFALVSASFLVSASVHAASPDERYYTASNLSAAKSKPSLGGLPQDFFVAANSTTLGEARTRWEEFLKNHGPGEAGFEDSFHRNHFRIGELELMRVYYLLGEKDLGDALIIKVIGRVPDAP
jgi:hypothetical protein